MLAVAQLGVKGHYQMNLMNTDDNTGDDIPIKSDGIHTTGFSYLYIFRLIAPEPKYSVTL